MMLYDLWMTKLFGMTLTASVVICAVLLLRLLLKKASKAISCALWLLVLFRLLCPVSLPSRYSVFSLWDIPSSAAGAAANMIDYFSDEDFIPVHTVSGETISGKTVSVDTISGETVSVDTASAEIGIPGTPDVFHDPKETGHPKDSALREETEKGSSLSVSPSDARRMRVTSVAFLLWACGVLGMLVYCLYSCVTLYGKLRFSVPLRDNIRYADGILSPVVVGLFRPKIYLPSVCGFGALGEREQAYILLHEEYHIRRLDHVFKALGFLALTVHWFNPLVWLAFVLASRDMEMSCDEAVIRTLGEDIRADYSASLLAFAAGKRMPSGFGMPPAFGESGTACRIRNLSRWKKPGRWGIAAALAVLAAAAVCLLTNPENTVCTVSITVPGGAEPGFYYSDEELSLLRGKLLIENLSDADTEFTLLPADADRSTAHAAPVTVRRNRTAALPAKRGTWYQLGIYTDNPSPVSKRITVTVKNAETRVEGFPLNWSVLEGILWTPGASWEYESPDPALRAVLTVKDDRTVTGTVEREDGTSGFTLLYRIRGRKLFADFYGCTGAGEADGSDIGRFLFTASAAVQKGDLIFSVTDQTGKDFFGLGADLGPGCAVFLHDAQSVLPSPDSTAASAGTNEITEIAGQYFCEQGGFGGDFTLTLYADGTYGYYEGSLSSCLGSGTWESDGDTVILHDPMGEDRRYKYFTFHGTYLTFDGARSSRFLYMDPADGACFLRYSDQTAAVPAGLTLTVTDASADDMEFLLSNGTEMTVELGEYNRVMQFDGEHWNTAVFHSIEPFSGNRKSVNPGDCLYGMAAWSGAGETLMLAPGVYQYLCEVLCRDPETGEQYPVILDAEFEIKA